MCVLQVCKYIDMPLQHINNLVLLAMNRPTREHTDKLLGKLRDRIPGLAIRTTFISGFPGRLPNFRWPLSEFCASANRLKQAATVLLLR